MVEQIPDLPDNVLGFSAKGTVTANFPRRHDGSRSSVFARFASSDEPLWTGGTVVGRCSRGTRNEHSTAGPPGIAEAGRTPETIADGRERPPSGLVAQSTVSPIRMLPLT